MLYARLEFSHLALQWALRTGKCAETKKGARFMRRFPKIGVPFLGGIPLRGFYSI